MSIGLLISLLLFFGAHDALAQFGTPASNLPAAAYGEIYVTEGSTAQTGVGATYVVVDFAADGISSGVTVDSTTDDDLVVITPGPYIATVGISFSGEINTEFEGAVHVDGTIQTNCKLDRKIGSGGDVGRGAVSCLLSLTAAEAVDFRMRAPGGGSNSFTVENATFFIVKQ